MVDMGLSTTVVVSISGNLRCQETIRGRVRSRVRGKVRGRVRGRVRVG